MSNEGEGGLGWGSFVLQYLAGKLVLSHKQMRAKKSLNKTVCNASKRNQLELLAPWSLVAFTAAAQRSR
jgi:hypothetical protein